MGQLLFTLVVHVNRRNHHKNKNKNNKGNNNNNNKLKLNAFPYIQQQGDVCARVRRDCWHF